MPEVVIVPQTRTTTAAAPVTTPTASHHLHFDLTYLKTLPGILQLVQIVSEIGSRIGKANPSGAVGEVRGYNKARVLGRISSLSRNIVHVCPCALF